MHLSFVQHTNSPPHTLIHGFNVGPILAQLSDSPLDPQLNHDFRQPLSFLKFLKCVAALVCRGRMPLQTKSPSRPRETSTSPVLLMLKHNTPDFGVNCKCQLLHLPPMFLCWRCNHSTKAHDILLLAIVSPFCQSR